MYKESEWMLRVVPGASGKVSCREAPGFIGCKREKGIDEVYKAIENIN